MRINVLCRKKSGSDNDDNNGDDDNNNNSHHGTMQKKVAQKKNKTRGWNVFKRSNPETNKKKTHTHKDRCDSNSSHSKRVDWYLKWASGTQACNNEHFATQPKWNEKKTE